MSVKYALGHSVMITGCSQGVLNSVSQSYGARNSSGWEVLYYGTELPCLPNPEERQAFRESFGWPEDTPIIVHIGRFAEQKNHFGVLRIFKLVLERRPGAKLLLIGAARCVRPWKRWRESWDCPIPVRFLGYRDDVPQILARSDLFLFPSWLEGLGVAALEASAAAIPVVASNIPAISEAVEHGGTGLLIDPK